MPKTRLYTTALYTTALSTLLASALLIGCASTRVDDADRPTLAEFDANLNQGVVLARILGMDGKQKAQQEAAASAKEGVLAAKLGVVVSDASHPELAQELVQAVAAAQADYPITLIPAPEMAQQLKAYGCEPSHLEGCIERLATYPGVQHLVQLAHLEADQGQVRATVQLYNATHGFKHAPVTLEQQTAAGGRANAQALRGLAAQILDAVSNAAAETPWSTRAFKQEGSEIFLAAGGRSGLKPGMVLTVHAPGRAITSPTGSLAGWIPGKAKGAIKVTALFGDDYAIAELVEGEAPGVMDPLLLEE